MLKCMCKSGFPIEHNIGLIIYNFSKDHCIFNTFSFLIVHISWPMRQGTVQVDFENGTMHEESSKMKELTP